MKRLLLVGGGLANATVVHQHLRAPLPGVRVAWVVSDPRLTYLPWLPEAVAGGRGLDEVTVDLKPLALAAGVDWVTGQVVSLDLAQRVLCLADGRQAEYDAIALDVGYGIARQVITGAGEHGLAMQPAQRFARLFDAVVDLAARRPLDLVVVSDLDAGLELTMAVQQRLGEVRGFDTRISLVCGRQGLLPGWPAPARNDAAAALRRCRITVIAEDCIELTGRHAHLSNGARLACDVPLLACSERPATWLTTGGLALDEHGRVATSRTLQCPSHQDAFVADHDGPGDSASNRLLALNLRRYLAGGQLLVAKANRQPLRFLSFGSRNALVRCGNWSAHGRWVWWLKQALERRAFAQLTTIRET